MNGETSPCLGQRPDGVPLEAVRNALATHLADAERGLLTDVSVIRTIRRAYSTVAFLDAATSAGTRRLVAKTVTFHPDNSPLLERENQAVVEYNVLKRLHPRFQETEGCTVPRPVLLLPESGTYIMEFVEGAVLADEFRRARWLASAAGFRTLQDHYYHCGRWLHLFQQFTKAPDTGVEAFAETLGLCEQWLGLIERWGDRRCGPEWAARGRQELREQAGRLSGVKVPAAGRHGDFGPWNVLAGRGGVAVLDFLGYAEEPVSIDPLRMLLVLEDERNCVTANPRRIDALRESFLAGYAPPPEVPEPALILSEAFQRLRTVWENLAKRPRWPHQRLGRRRCLAASLAWLGGERRQLLWPR
jgi:hypothetical protein